MAVAVAHMIQCKFCGNYRRIVAWRDEWTKWLGPNPPMVQNCFPDMSPENREMLISGICPDCWDEAFGE